MHCAQITLHSLKVVGKMNVCTLQIKVQGSNCNLASLVKAPMKKKYELAAGVCSINETVELDKLDIRKSEAGQFEDYLVKNHKVTYKV